MVIQSPTPSDHSPRWALREDGHMDSRREGIRVAVVDESELVIHGVETLLNDRIPRFSMVDSPAQATLALIDPKASDGATLAAALDRIARGERVSHQKRSRPFCRARTPRSASGTGRKPLRGPFAKASPTRPDPCSDRVRDRIGGSIYPFGGRQHATILAKMVR